MGTRRMIAVAVTALVMAGVPITEAQAGDMPAAPSASVGDCVTYPFQGDPSAIGVVAPCSQRHNAEVFRVITLSSTYPAPSVESGARTANISARCGMARATSVLGLPTSLPALGQLSVAYVLPTDSQWNAGARWAVCSVFWRTYQASPYARSWSGRLSAKVAGLGPERFYSCLSGQPGTAQTVQRVTCSGPPQWLQITYLAPSKGSRVRDCRGAAERVIPAGQPITYYRAAGTTGGITFMQCFVPLASVGPL